jgi:hypothetical protein
MEPFWKKTIEELSPLISYPSLEKKYLKRPPFKYILQIFISLDKKTNFTKNKFSEKELNKDTYNRAEPKMKFLKKLMAIVANLGGKGQIVKPQSIVKGVDCEKTNEFLRELGRVAMLDERKQQKKSKKQRPGEHVRKALNKAKQLGIVEGMFINKISWNNSKSRTSHH